MVVFQLIMVSGFISSVVSQSQNQMQCILNNVNGCNMIRTPTYLVVAPGKIRPLQVINVFVTALSLEYGFINIRLSVVQDQMEYAAKVLRFDAPSSKILELMLPSNAKPGRYKIRTEGFLHKQGSGNVFFNETDIDFDKKQASIFIQTSKPIYRQGQTVRFRVIPILPNLMPKHGSMTIFIMDPSKTPVYRWQKQQTNAGGFVAREFVLSHQPKFGDWAIRIEAYGFTYEKVFKVIEYYQERFDINVTVPPFVLSDAEHINGTVFANHSSGRAVMGNASIELTIVRPGETYDHRYPHRYPNPLRHVIDFFDNGRIDFTFGREDIMLHSGLSSLADMEFIFNVSVYDWELMMKKTGYGSTYCHQSRIFLRWVGGAHQAFKPDSVFTATVAIMHTDGTPVLDPSTRVSITPVITGQRDSTARSEHILPVNGFATFSIYAHKEAQLITLEAQDELGTAAPASLRVHRYHSPGSHFVTVSTSTRRPRVNEYIIFHVRTSVYVPKVYYQIVSQGNILLGDEIRMISRQKTFSIAVSRDMIPTARIVVYYVHQPEEIVADALNFFVNGTRLNSIDVQFNSGKDFTHHTVEVAVHSEAGSYAAIAALPYDLYNRGFTDGISENQVIDELLTYDAPANGSYLHKWRVSETEYSYHFFTANTQGVDAPMIFRMSGLRVMTDAALYELPNAEECRKNNRLPCFNRVNCYDVSSKCDGTGDCPDFSDEYGCPEKELKLHGKHPIDRISLNIHFFDDSGWMWKEDWIKPYGSVRIKADVPKFPLTWIVNGFSLHPDKGFGIIERPARLEPTRMMFIQVEAPQFVVRGEQIGFRVSVFNYWYGDDFLEVMVKLHSSDYYKYVNVESFGSVLSHDPRTSFGEHMTLVYLEAGESRDIYLPVLPVKWVDDKINVTISAISFISNDVVTKTLHVQNNGVVNLYHTPYLVDMITKGAVTIPDIDIPIRSTPVIPQERDLAFIPETPEVIISVFGDVVTPGFFEDYLTAENVLGRPYGSGEMTTFNLAYNLYTLQFIKASKQLGLQEIKRSMIYLNIGLQRLFSYMTINGSFYMFKDDDKPSLWLSAFVAKTLDNAHVGDWDQYLFIPIEIVTRIVLWICEQQDRSTGAFNPLGTVFDRKMAKLSDQKSEFKYDDPVTLTAYVTIALKKISHVSTVASPTIKNAITQARQYLLSSLEKIKDEDVFLLAITTYALSVTGDVKTKSINRLFDLKRHNGEYYWADQDIPPIPSQIQNTVKSLKARIEHVNDAYGVQTTAYVLLTILEQTKPDKSLKNSVMRWLQTMRNTLGGFISTQDTIVAMEALTKFAEVDPNRNYFDISFDIVATAGWTTTYRITGKNYTTPLIKKMSKPWGYIQMTAIGTGRALLQVSSSSRHQFYWQLKNPKTPAFNLSMDEIKFSGRNSSMVDMKVCARWFYTSRSLRSGLAVIEVDMPTGFVVTNTSLRSIVQSRLFPNLKFAEFYWRKVVFYFAYLDESLTCLNFRADRWYPVANATEYHMMRVYDYYEPGFYNHTLYTTVDLHNLDLCYACASFQCPYCPQFNRVAVIKGPVPFVSILVFFTFMWFLVTT